MKKIAVVFLSAMFISMVGCDTVKNVATNVIEIIHEVETTPAPAPAPVPTPVPNPVEPTPLSVDAIDLTKVTWVHARGQNIAAWPITAKLGRVEFKLPNVCSYDMDWPTNWTGYGDKNVTASHVVIAKINGQLYGGAWESMYRGVAACRPLEVMRDSVPNMGPFGQVEQDPFWQWYPQTGDEVCFIVTSWIREGVKQPVGRSAAYCTVWP